MTSEPVSAGELSGLAALVTGGGSGVGLAAARLLASRPSLDITYGISRCWTGCPVRPTVDRIATVSTADTPHSAATHPASRVTNLSGQNT